MGSALSRILCIGALHLDHTIQCIGDPALGESNPANTAKSYGGVAFNISRSLSQLECISGLASRLGADRAGADIIDHLGTTQIRQADIGTELDGHTATYTAIIDAQGRLIIGLADMKIYDLLDDQYWSNRIDNLRDWDAWCLDTNLPESGLRYLMSQKNRPRLYVVASSPTKALRLKSLLQDIDTLILNISEATMITRQSPEGADAAKIAAEWLCTAGVDRTIVTHGGRGAAWADASGTGIINSFLRNQDMVRTSGAGDTLAAVTIAALEKGLSTSQALKFGILASHHFMRRSSSDFSINWDDIAGYE